MGNLFRLGKSEMGDKMEDLNGHSLWSDLMVTSQGINGLSLWRDLKPPLIFHFRFTKLIIKTLTDVVQWQNTSEHVKVVVGSSPTIRLRSIKYKLQLNWIEQNATSTHYRLQVRVLLVCNKDFIEQYKRMNVSGGMVDAPLKGGVEIP